MTSAPSDGPPAAGRQLVATWGEALLRLSPPPGERLRQARRLDLQVGGSEANVAVGLATLGLGARWLSAVSDDELGETVLSAVRAHGVDVGQVARRRARTGTYYYEPGDAGRPAAVFYDREASAFTTLAADEVATGWLDGCSALHTSGISLLLTGQAAAATARLWALAGEAGLRRSFDLNHRHRLGSPHRWADVCRPYLQSCDLLFVAERDACELYGLPPGEPAEIMQRLRAIAPQAEIVLTRAELGAAALPRGSETALLRPARAIGEVGRIGRGDAFAAGYLYSQAREPGDACAALERGIAAASYKSGLAGDLPVLDLQVIEEQRENAKGRDVRR